MSNSLDNLSLLVTTLNAHLQGAAKASALLTKVRSEGRLEPSDAELLSLQADDDVARAAQLAALAAAKADIKSEIRDEISRGQFGLK